MQAAVALSLAMLTHATAQQSQQLYAVNTAEMQTAYSKAQGGAFT
jgi:hypothetical protein